MEGEGPKRSLFFGLKFRKSLRQQLQQQIDEMSSPVSGGTNLTMGQAELDIVQNVSQSLSLPSGVDIMDIPIVETGTNPGLGNDKISSTISFIANTCENGHYPQDEDDVDQYPVDYVDGDIDNSIENNVENDGEVKVSINFKLGSMGRSGRAYEHLNSLHDQTRLLGIDMTWEDAIREEFGVELDSGRYFMRRVDPSAPQHNLNSPISALLDEFNTPPTGDWRVTILDRVQRQKALGPPPKPKPQQRQRPPAKKARLHQTSIPAAAAAATGIGGHGIKSEHLYRHQPKKTWIVGHDAGCQEDLGDLELPKANTITFNDHDDDDASSDYGQESQDNVVVMEGEGPKKSPFFGLKFRKSLQKRLRQQLADGLKKGDTTIEMSSPVGGVTDLTIGPAELTIVQNVSQSLLLHSGVDSMDIPILETGTNPGLGDGKISNTVGVIGFNANTCGPLRLRPVPPRRRRVPNKTFSSDPDAFKILFYERTKHSLTNDMLLKARHDLQQLKANSTPGNNNHWTKWMLASPLPTSILRTLFDV